MFNPELPSIKTYKKKFTEIEFPLVFRICANEIEDSTERYKEYGYRFDYSYFIGQSIYNRSLIGWNGHTKEGGTIASIEGLMKMH